MVNDYFKLLYLKLMGKCAFKLLLDLRTKIELSTNIRHGDKAKIYVCIYFNH